MSWECADCGRRHDDPPETCACGSADVAPVDGAVAGEGSGRFSLLAVKRRLFAPEEADRSLVSDDDRLTLVFRALVVLSLLLAFVALLALLV